MRYFLSFLLCILLCYGVVHAYSNKHRERGLPRTEVGLMNNVLGCLQHKDSVGYFNLFVPFDSLWSMVMHNPDKSPAVVKQLDHLKEHPQALLEFDPYFNHNILGRFYHVIQKGEDSGIHWDAVVMQRYELTKADNTNSTLIGYSLIAPERFKGYIFVRDLLGRLTFCITITEIQKINGYFFGGQITNILEAASVDEYNLKAVQEQRYFDWLAKNPDYDSLRTDSLHVDSVKKGLIDTTLTEKERVLLGLKANNLNTAQVDDDKNKIRKEVVDRKYYEGKFDDEIPVKLFIRYMKDAKSGKVVSYDGLYRFGDQKSYAKLIITIEADGKWLIEDDPPIGTMELELKSKTYTGSWTNNENQTGYDVLLKQADIAPQRLIQLENILEKNLSGTVNEESDENKGNKKVAKKKDDDDDDKPLTKEDKKKKQEDEEDKEQTKEERKALKKEQRKKDRQEGGGNDN